MPFVHIAGLRLEIGSQVIQRCAACGMLLCDNTGVAMPVDRDGHEREFATWEVGGLVEFDGNRQSAISHSDGETLPSDFCLNHQS